MAKPPLGSLIAVRTDPSIPALVATFKTSQQIKVSASMWASANAVKANLRQTTPRGRTLRLVNSQRLVKVSDLEFQIVETVDPAYGLFQRLGVLKEKINPIYPREKKALYWPGARHPVKVVRNHPGIKPNDYYQTAIDMSRGAIKANSEKVGFEIEAEIEEL